MHTSAFLPLFYEDKASVNACGIYVFTSQTPNAAVDGPGSGIIDARIIFSGNPACRTHLFTGSAADCEHVCLTGLPSTAAFIGGSAIAEQPMNASLMRPAVQATETWVAMKCGKARMLGFRTYPQGRFEVLVRSWPLVGYFEYHCGSGCLIVKLRWWHKFFRLLQALP